MSEFLRPLEVELAEDTSHEGRGTWRLMAPLAYVSDVAKQIITVPRGFLTDFASVPRLPLVFWLTGDCAHEAAVIHDWLYATQVLPRALADQVLREAMLVSGVPAWRCWGMYFAVRLFGASFFKSKEPS